MVFLFFFVFLSCSSEKKDWERAESENTFKSYSYFLERHQEGILADKARLKIQEIYFEAAESTGTIKAYENFLRWRCSPTDPLADKARLKIQEIKLFKEVQKVDNIPTYKAFLKDHPQHPRADKVRRRIEELYQVRHPAVKNTETIKILVRQSYSSEFSDSESISLPFEEMGERVFGGAGLKAVNTDVEKADVILKIHAKGRALGEMYKDEKGMNDYRYTGASLSGTISLEVPGIPVIKKSFKGVIDPPEVFKEYQWSDLYNSPDQAPFDDIIFRSGSFLTKILEMLEDFYGFAALSSVYEIILREEFQYICYKSGFYFASTRRFIPRIAEVVALGEIKDKRAIELLIKAMDCSRETRLKALEKLRSLTGQDLGEEQRIWENWWEKNKRKFLEKK